MTLAIPAGEARDIAVHGDRQENDGEEFVSAWNPSKLGVLVVDDEQSVRTMIKSMLKQLQINQVLEAENGHEAMNLIGSSAGTLNVVICDWTMPTVSGIELLRQVRSTGSSVPFVMVTGKADKDSVLEAKDAGVSAYIAKPLTLVQLEAKLRAVISKH